MGLDTVELVMEIEHAFDIKIPDPEAEKILTVGDFHDSVWRHLADRHSNKCHSQSLFYKLRNGLWEEYGISRQSYTLDSNLEDIFPKTDRRKNYMAFASKFGLELPSLVLPPKPSAFLSTLALIFNLGILISTLVLTIFFDYSLWILLLIIVAIYVTVFVSNLLEPWRTIVSPNSTREFTMSTLAINYKTLSKSEGTNRKEMEAVMNQIIADKAGLDLDEITPDKNICDDLGLN